MKTCPTCSRTFTDEALSLCPEDGSFLIEAGSKKAGIRGMMFVYLLLVLGGVAVALYYRNSILPSTAAGEAVPQATWFEATECKSVRDSRTGLEWFVGPDRNLSWPEAQSWAAELSACGGGWRMPSMQEITALYDPSKTAGAGYRVGNTTTYRQANIDPIFSAIGSGAWVWSGETPSGTEATAFDLNQGKVRILARTNNVYALRGFAVRSSATSDK